MRLNVLLLVAALSCIALVRTASAAERPNILWITSEDNGCHLGCYGDSVARTPNLDAFAKTATRYELAFSNAAVCAPARQTLITGCYATSLGGQHMRSNVVYPEPVRYFPEYLRTAGYHTSNNSKTDYNGGPAQAKDQKKDAAKNAAWNASNKTAHWRARKADQPFFAVFNIGDTHESRLFPGAWKNRELKTDPATVKLPAYLPDLPETRLDMARYYDCLESMDAKVGKILRELEDDGLADDTIVFYFSDHGGSMPRGKSFVYDSGTKVPLLIRVPERWKDWRSSPPGGSTERMVSFVDFAPTVLHLAGLDIPEHMQGAAFLGEQPALPRHYVHLFRDRRGERYDMVRAVRSADYLYVRNFTAHWPVMQNNEYSFEIPGYRAWRDSGQKSSWFTRAKPVEALYDVRKDPDQTRNLLGVELGMPPILAEHDLKLRQHMLAVRDTGLIPEGMTGRSAAMARDADFPYAEILDFADGMMYPETAKKLPLAKWLDSPHPVQRWWAALACEQLGRTTQNLHTLFEDPEPVVQIQAARAWLANSGVDFSVEPLLRANIAHENEMIRLQAWLVIDEFKFEADWLAAELKKPRGAYPKRVTNFIERGRK